MPTDAHEPRLDVTTDANRTTVRFINCTSLNEYNADRVGKQLLAVADGTAGRQVTLDLEPVEYLTSTVLGHLVALHKRLAMSGGRLSLENARPTVRNILHITLLDQVIDLRPSTG